MEESILDKTRKGRSGVEVKCLNCDITMLVEPSRLADGRGKFCSRKCSTVYMNTVTHSQLGEENNNWRGGISKDHYHYKKIQKYRYPERVRARQLVNEALRKGRMLRLPCEVCSEMEDVQSHHEDYSKPYEVRFLCPKHHKEVDEGRLKLPPAEVMDEEVGWAIECGTCQQEVLEELESGVLECFYCGTIYESRKGVLWRSRRKVKGVENALV